MNKETKHQKVYNLAKNGGTTSREVMEKLGCSQTVSWNTLKRMCEEEDKLRRENGENKEGNWCYKYYPIKETKTVSEKVMKKAIRLIESWLNTIEKRDMWEERTNFLPISNKEELKDMLKELKKLKGKEIIKEDKSYVRPQLIPLEDAIGEKPMNKVMELFLYIGGDDIGEHMKGDTYDFRRLERGGEVEKIKSDLGGREEEKVDIKGSIEAPEDEIDDIIERFGKDKIERISRRHFKVKDKEEAEILWKCAKKDIDIYSSTMDESLIASPENNITLREYQKEAVKEFFNEKRLVRNGNLTVSLPPSGGKTFIGLEILSRIKGKKLVLVPTNNLKEQWKDRIIEHTNLRVGDDVIVKNYQSNPDDEDYSLIIFDENHRLPADKWKKWALKKRPEFRLGLTATPQRLDGREEWLPYVVGPFANINWTAPFEKGYLEKPEIEVVIVDNYKDKISMVKSLLKNETFDSGLIFCNEIYDKKAEFPKENHRFGGKHLQAELGKPFVHSESELDINQCLREDDVVIGTKVIHEGISKNVDLGIGFNQNNSGRSGSELIQQIGRIMHGEGRGKYIELMTKKEFCRFGTDKDYDEAKKMIKNNEKIPIGSKFSYLKERGFDFKIKEKRKERSPLPKIPKINM